MLDPGAASNLCGTNTLLEHSERILWPRGITYKVKYPPNNFTGINGEGERSSGRVDMPIGLEGIGLAYWTTDLMGGTGSGCPALLANKSLVALAAASVTDVFEDHGGILASQLMSQQHFFFRIGFRILDIIYFLSISSTKAYSNIARVGKYLREAPQAHDQQPLSEENSCDASTYVRNKCTP